MITSRGPPNVKLQGLNSLHLMVSGLHTDGSNPTVYLFTFTARNRMNQEISDSAFVFLYSSTSRREERGRKGGRRGEGGERQ